MDMDPYQTLGISENASDQDIKSAFKNLAKKYHPDRGGDESKFKEINEAYDKIKTQEKRQQYEASKQFGGDGFNFNFAQGDPFDMQDMFAQFFGGDPFNQGRRAYRRQPTNKNIQIDLEITLLEAFHGTKKFFNLDQLPNKINIDVPPGVDHGQTIRYKGLGTKNIKNQPPGDLLVKIHIKPHPDFKRNKLDLHTETSVSAFEAIIGTSKEIKTVDGISIKLKIPAGTQPNTTLRIPQHGMRNGMYVGDFFVHVNVSIPKNLTEEDMDAIRQFAKTYS